MSADKGVSLFERNPVLLADPKVADPTVIIITDKGPRHLDLPAYLAIVQSPAFTQKHFDEQLGWRLQVVSEQAFTRALEALDGTAMLFDKVPLFYLPDTSVPPPVRSQPDHIADARDYAELGAADAGLAFINAIEVHQGRQDWRGNYSANPPVPTPCPEPPMGESTVEQWRLFHAEHGTWVEQNRRDRELHARWRTNSSPRLQTADGTRADVKAQTVILRAAVEAAAAQCGLDYKLPLSEEGVDVFDPALLVPALVKSVQELSALINSDAFKNDLADRVAQRSLDAAPVRSKRRSGKAG